MSTDYRDRHRLGSRNWLVHRIHDAALEKRLRDHARGRLLDIGCGDKPYEALTAGLVDRHIGLDHPASEHDPGRADVLALAYDTGLAPECIDTVLCTFVLEHLEEPARALAEIRRVLRPGGVLLLSAPQFWHLHEKPRDFWRYTRYGLEHLLAGAGLEAVEVTPLSGFAVTFFQEAAYLVGEGRRGPLRRLRLLVRDAILGAGWLLHRFDRSHDFTWAWLCVARKPESAASSAGTEGSR